LTPLLTPLRAQHAETVFRSSVINEVRRLYFEIRLWDGEDLVDRVLENYDRLPDEVQAELPLKRIWTLVPEE
jgi:restriction system protein